MPEYTRLTLAQFKALFPAFSSLTQEQYDTYVVKAEKQANTCLGDLYQEGVELLTAHMLALNNVGIGTGAAFLANSGATSFKSGTFDASISSYVAEMKAKGGFNATPYGQQYRDLIRYNCGGPRLAGSVGGCC